MDAPVHFNKPLALDDAFNRISDCPYEAFAGRQPPHASLGERGVNAEEWLLCLAKRRSLATVARITNNADKDVGVVAIGLHQEMGAASYQGPEDCEGLEEDRGRISFG